jgi:hypothetical protein
MTVKRILGVAILGAGVILLAFGINSTKKFPEKIIKEVNGRYTDTTMWYLIGGVVFIIVGGGLTLSRKNF